MRLDWFSKTGARRACNCDAACYGVTDLFLAVAIVDAAEGAKAQAFAKHWAYMLVAAVDTCGSVREPKGLIHNLQKAQSELRHTFLHEFASYALAILDLRSNEGVLLAAGDCRACTGQQGDSSLLNKDWLNRPHTADRQISEMGEPYSVESGLEHILTRSINAKRFVAPDAIPFSIRQGQQLILATDGYWRESPKHANSPKSDDSSALYLTWGGGTLEIHVESDTDNLGTHLRK